MDINKWKSYVELLQQTPAEEGSLAFFSDHPSTSSYMKNHAHLQPAAFPSRLLKNSSMDTFWSQTLNTPDTIKHAVLLISKDIMNLQYQILEEAQADDWVPDVSLLVQLGSRINGWEDTVHGGVLASLLDECLGCAVETVRCSLVGTNGLTTTSPLYTANLNINYRRPAESPGMLIVEARMHKREGRKWLLHGRILGEDGKVRVDATSLWIAGGEKM